jgi:adenylate cyclase
MTAPGEAFRFTGFRFDPGEGCLFRENGSGAATPVTLGSRAKDLLALLLDRPGELVTKDEIFAAVWPGIAVEEANLTMQISALRRIIDRERERGSCIQTIPGRGYRFVAPVTRAARSARADPAASKVGAALPDKPSIAVLPFVNLSGSPEQEYFAGGMVEEIITALSRIRWLFVIARNSTTAYKGQAIDVRQVGRELGVRYVLEGSVRCSGGQVRITAQLLDALTAAHLWADRFDGPIEHIFDMQDSVATCVAGVIEPTLQAAEAARSTGKPTSDLSAYDLYLRADAMMISSAALIPEALRLLEQAIARDGQYGPALALAAVCRLRLVQNGRSEDPVSDSRAGADFARRALQIARDDPGTLVNAALALAYFGEDIGAMMGLVDRSLMLNPSFARGWYISSMLRGWAGQHDLAIEHIERSLRLSSRARVGLAIYNCYGSAHLFSRRFAEAEPNLRLAIQEDPNYPTSYRFLAACLAHMDRLDEARDIVAQLRRLAPAVFPPRPMFRRPEDEELLVSGLRLAIGKEGAQVLPARPSAERRVELP